MLCVYFLIRAIITVVVFVMLYIMVLNDMYIHISLIGALIGVYVANRASDKITQLTDNVYVCRSGSVLIPFLDLCYCVYGIIVKALWVFFFLMIH